MKNEKKRLVNLDLLKVISMIMIVCLHFLGKSDVLNKLTLTDSNFYVAWIFELMSIVGVNCFVLCSGYLMAKNHFKFSKLIYLWLQIVFISAVCLIVAFCFADEKPTLSQIVGVFLPINWSKYWFMSAYFAFYLMSPILIWVANKLTLKQLKMLVIALIAVFSLSPWQWTNLNKGYHCLWFAVLFFVAAYIRRADLLKKKPRVYLGYYFMLIFVLLAMKIALMLISNHINAAKAIDVRSYNFFFTFLASLMLFSAFKNMKIEKARIGGFISFLSSLTLGVYLFHENEMTRSLLWYKLIKPLDFIDKPYFAVYLVVAVLAVFFTCAFFEYFRQLLFKLFSIPSLSDKWGKKLQSIADKVFDGNFIEKM